MDSGFGTALVQKIDADNLDYNTVFYFNIFVSVLCYWLLFWAAPLVSEFYNQPQLTDILRILALNIVISSLTLVPHNILYKRLAFRQLAIINTISMSVSGVAAIVAALNGFGAWSLVLQHLCGSLLKVPLFFLLCPWKPRLTFSGRRLRPLFSYGSKIFGAALVQRIFDNIYSIVIGKMYSAEMLGHFHRAASLQNIPTRILTISVSSVTFPLFSEIQDDRKRLKQHVRKAIMLEAFVVFPALAGVATIALPFVKVFLTEKWLPCVPYVYLLCMASIAYPMKIINQNVLRATGRSDLFMYNEIISKILLILCLVITVRYGITAMLVGNVAHSWIMWGMLAYQSGRLIDYSPREQCLDVAPMLWTSILMGVVVIGLGQVIPCDILKLILLPICGALVYVLVSFVCKISMLNEVILIMRNRLGVAP